MTDVIRIIGRSGSGKTTLLCEVVRLLADSGLRVAVFKHAHHRVDLDRKGKDSFRFAAAGAAFVTVVSPEKVAAFEAVHEREPTLEELWWGGAPRGGRGGGARPGAPPPVALGGGAAPR